MDFFILFDKNYVNLNKSHAEGNFVYTGNMDNEEEVNYFDMVFRILNAFVITNPDAPAYPTSVLVRILSNSENQCFLNCVMSFMPAYILLCFNTECN